MLLCCTKIKSWKQFFWKCCTLPMIDKNSVYFMPAQNKKSDTFIKQVFSLFLGLNQLEGQVVRYSNENLVSPNDNTVHMDTQRSGTGLRRTLSATTPPSNLMFAQSPPNMEGPVAFVAPGLAEETLMGVGRINLFSNLYISKPVNLNNQNLNVIHVYWQFNSSWKCIYRLSGKKRFTSLHFRQ